MKQTPILSLYFTWIEDFITMRKPHETAFVGDKIILFVTLFLLAKVALAKSKILELVPNCKTACTHRTKYKKIILISIAKIT